MSAHIYIYIYIYAEIHDRLPFEIFLQFGLHHGFHWASNAKGTKTLWRLLAKCFEKGIADDTELNNDEKRRATEHEKINLQKVKIATNCDNPEFHNDQDEAMESLHDNESEIGNEAKWCAKQGRRLQEMVHQLRRKAAVLPARSKAQECYARLSEEDRIDMENIACKPVSETPRWKSQV